MEDIFKTQNENFQEEDKVNNEPKIEDMISDDDDVFNIGGFDLENIDPLLKQNKEVEEKKVEQNQDNDFDIIKEFNKKFGTNYTNEEEIKNSLKKDDSLSDLTPEQEREIETNSEIIKNLQNVISLDDKKLLKIHLLGLKKQELGEDFDKEIAEMDIDEKLENWERNGTLSYNSDKLKEEIKKEIEKIDDKNKSLLSIKNKKSEIEEEKKINTIKESLIDIYKSNTFFGIKPEQEVLNKVYNKIVTNKFAEELSGDFKLLTELAMMLEYKNEIQKRATRPTADQGRKEVLDEFLPGSRKHQTLDKARGGNSGNRGSLSIVDSLLYKGDAKQ